MLKQDSVLALQAEINRAREKFPKPDGLIAALVEEVGEFAQEIYAGPDESQGDFSDFIARARNEVLQIACVAMRIYEEGDPLRGHREIHQLMFALRASEGLARHCLRMLGLDAEKSTT